MTSATHRSWAVAVTSLILGALVARGLAQQSPRVTTVQVIPTGTLAPALTMGVVEETGKGVISGRVVDSSGGRPVPGVVVSLGNTTPSPPSRSDNSGQVVLASMAAVSRGEAARAVSATDPDLQPLPRMVTDAEGRFTFRDLPAGVFHLTARRPGYFDGAYGRLRPDGGALPLSLAQDEHRDDVTIRLFRPAAIGGTVRDDAGDAVVGVLVRAYRRSVIAGRRVVAPTDVSTSTDDRGMYRLGNLVPGEYIVAMPTMQTSVPASFQVDGASAALGATMTPFNAGSLAIGSGGTKVTSDGRFLLQDADRVPGTMSIRKDGRALVYPTTYAPAAKLLAQASVIAVAPGEDRLGVDLQTEFVPTANISGRLAGPEGPGVNYVLHLVPSEAGDLSSDPDVATAVTDGSGEFQFLAVPAGQYVVQTVRSARGGSPPGTGVSYRNSGSPRGGGPAAPMSAATLWTARPVSLGTDDLTDVSLTLRAGVKVSGRAEFSGAAEPPKSDTAPVFMTADAADGRFRGSSSLARVDATGRFTIDGLVPGKYILRPLGVGPGWTARSAVLNGVDVLDVPFDVADRDVSGVVVTFTDRTTTLRGRIARSNGNPDDSAVAIVFPADNRAWMSYGLNARRMRMARSTADGAFTLTGLPPGEYVAAAVGDELAGEWQDPQFLARVSQRGARVTLHEGDQISQDLVTQTIRPGGVEAVWRPANADGVAHGPFVEDPSGEAAGFLSTALGAVSAPEPATRQSSPATASISGVVLADDGSKQPIRYARVSVSSASLTSERTTATDQAGRFTVPSLPAGRYTVVASKPAYLAAYNGARRPGRGPGIPVIVNDGQAITGVALRLARGAVITGALKDDFGLPMPWTNVLVTEIKTINGERVKGVLTRVQTDDRGVYRAFGLWPGSYLVGVSPTPLTYSAIAVRQAATPAAPGRAVNYAPVYYPGTAAAADASLVTVVAGQEAANIDVPMHLVPAAHIQGVAIGTDGNPVGRALVSCMPADPNQIAGMLQTRADAADDGTFVIANVPPGRYVLTFTPSSSFRAGDTAVRSVGGNMWALADVEVNGQNIDGFVLRLQEGLTVSGHVTFAGRTSSPPQDPTKFGITLQAIDPNRRNGAATIDTSGNFIAKGLAPGRYRVTMTPASSAGPWRLRSAVVEGHDAADQPIELGPGRNIEDMAVTFTDQATELSGTLRGADSTPAPGYTLMVFPTDRSMWTAGSRRVTQPLPVADDGTFTVTGLPAGEYYVAALTDVDPGEATTAPFLEQAAAVATRVTLVEGEKKVLDLKIAR